MTVQLSTSIRNARLDAIPATAGPAAHLEIYTAPVPTSPTDPATGTRLVEYDLASTWADPATGGASSLADLPLVVNAVATGVAAYFRLYRSDDATCFLQGTVSTNPPLPPDPLGDMIIDNTLIVLGQTVVITAFTLRDGNV